MTIETRNAVIESTMLGIEDHGIMTCVLHLNFDGWSQGFGTHDLAPPAYGVAYLRRILETVGVDTWEQLRGKVIRARTDYGKIHAIGNVIKDVWFAPETDLIA